MMRVQRNLLVRFVLPPLLGILAVQDAPGEPSAGPETPAPAVSDSTLFAEFAQLDPEQIESRTKEAAKLRENAADMSHGPRRLETLSRAVALDPVHPSGWVELADVQRQLGYRAEAAASFETALFMVKQTEGKEKKQFGAAYLMARAWLDYEQADWDGGKSRADRAVKLLGTQQAHLIAALCRAGTAIKDKEMRYSLLVFYPMDTNTNRQRNFMWAYRVWRHLHQVPYFTPDALGYKPDSFKFPDHEVLRWRDMGLIQEANDDDHLALEDYSKSAQYHPLGEGGWMTRREREIPGAKPYFPPMPFWVNPDEDYVTGSLLAYEGFCRDRMKAETDPGQRARWAERVVWAGTAAIPRYPRRPWTRLWRGEAFLELDLFKEAENDITFARSWFDEYDITEPALNPVEGHVFLLGKYYNQALPVLEQAVLDFPEDAGAWADLGLVRVRKAGRDPARAAFNRALELDPSLAVAWHNRGLLNLQDRRFDEAAADLEKAAELAPHDPQVTADLARIRQIMQYQDQ